MVDWLNGKRTACLSRRRFLRLAGASMASVLAAACAGRLPWVQESSSPLSPSSSFSSELPTYQVAIGQAQRYERAAVEKAVRTMLDALGGLGDILHRGDRVAIKVNLTGGVRTEPPGGPPAVETYVTHPEVVRALVACLKDAGAREVSIVEAIYEWESFTRWGYEELAREMGATLVDLNDAKPYAAYTTLPVGEQAWVYPHFTVNPILADVDVFISVAKMKHHWNCGVTHAMKNLIGLVPLALYRQEANHRYRSALHGAASETRQRLPRVIVDLCRARPIHLALVDGIMTVQGGEGPWIQTMRPITPGLLVAGKNPVATDAVATALMGHEPTADYPALPFIRGENHLNLAREAGLGTNRLEEIYVLGPRIEEVRYPFDPGW